MHHLILYTKRDTKGDTEGAQGVKCSESKKTSLIFDRTIMYLLLILLPLLGSVFAGLFGRSLGRRGSVVITITFLLTTFFLSVVAFYEVALCGSICSIKVVEWFSSEMFDSSWGFYFDSLTVVMLIVITSVSSLVHIYSVSYMAEDPHLPRFMSYLSIFTFFMLMLVTDRKSTRLNSSHSGESRMPSSA